MARTPMTDEQIKQAEHLLAEGMPVTKVADAVGVTPPTIYRRIINKGDPKPGGNRTNAPRKRSKPAPTEEQLASMLTKAAVAPALPMGLWVRCEFCAEHFVRTGPAAAKQLVEMSQDEPALRAVLEWCYRYYAQAAWAGILATWAGVPIAHHLAPDFIYRWIQLPLGMPARGVDPTHTHPPTNGNNGGPVPPPPTPFAGMDTESILRMAEGMGIKIEMPDFAAMAEQPPDPEPVTDAPTAATDAPDAEQPEQADTATPDAPSADAADTHA